MRSIGPALSARSGYPPSRPRSPHRSQPTHRRGQTAAHRLTATPKKPLYVYVGLETILAVGRGLSGTAQVSRGSQQWSLPIQDGGSDLSTVNLEAAGIDMGPVVIALE